MSSPATTAPTLLHLDASPRGARSNSRRLGQDFLAAFRYLSHSMRNDNHFGDSEPGHSRLTRMGFPDRTSAAVVGGCVVAIILFIWVVPKVLRKVAEGDIDKAPVLTAPGVVESQFYSVNLGNGDLLVTTIHVSFAGKEAAYRLPLGSPWQPKKADRVQVTYRIGSQSGLVHVDLASPLPTAK